MLVLDFPYDATQVSDIKRVPGAKWDRLLRVWTVPATEWGAVRDFATRWAFFVDPDLERLIIPDKGGGSRIEVDDAGLLLYFPYDQVKIARVQEIPGATWDLKKKAWRVPTSSLVEALEWASEFGLRVPEHLVEQQAGLHAEQHELIELSRAIDDNFEVAGLAGELMPFQRAAVRYVLRTKRSFVADEMGTGKTIYVSKSANVPRALMEKS